MLQEDRQILRSAQWGLAAMPAPISFGLAHIGTRGPAHLSAARRPPAIARCAIGRSLAHQALICTVRRINNPSRTRMRICAFGESGGDGQALANRRCGGGNQVAGAGHDWS
jgi:hypothetical protein